MIRNFSTWSLAACPVIAFLVALGVGLGVIESITLAGVATIGWSFVIRIARGLRTEEGGFDAPRH